ncbi:MAG: Shedu immune nuclease family protein [Candidatus Paceibacterota bacterium]
MATLIEKLGLDKFYHNFKDYENTDFVIGKDSFLDVVISDSAKENGFWYFKNQKKGLIKRFVLQVGPQSHKVCVVTLIRNSEGKFVPHFDFSIWDTTKKSFELYEKKEINDIPIKAKVDLGSCHNNFLLLIEFIRGFREQIDFNSSSLVVIEKEKKDIFDDVTKDVAIQKFSEKFGKEITEQDINLLNNRRNKLNIFYKLLRDEVFFSEQKKKRNIIRDELLWQIFFEANPWIFGYGLQLIACENLDDKKLEQTVVGNDIIDGAGKRIDALLKTKGNVSKFIFCEIKNHHKGLLVEEYNRPGVFMPGRELRGAIAQIQKTIHKVTIKVNDNYLKLYHKNGDPTGEEVLFVKPKGLVVIGILDDFKTENGINYEKLSSFELYRQQIGGIEIITYDELYERVRFIVEK